MMYRFVSLITVEAIVSPVRVDELDECWRSPANCNIHVFQGPRSSNHHRIDLTQHKLLNYSFVLFGDEIVTKLKAARKNTDVLEALTSERLLNNAEDARLELFNAVTRFRVASRAHK